MVAPMEHLRGHVSGCARRFTRIIVSYRMRDTEIGQPKIALVVENKILWFYISMDDICIVDCL